ncbi:hypothetical protein Y1Q_0012679 [Alligator mississippiensis]|uniref:Uncharacterized protein n=1 Tax=Alligator mississippiensis TaxID=8496 RepID=A0A151M8J6_ALLMI|nr:hypothetical protein Y1Q_0012679 [Alligator mississippiensis]
MIKSASKSDAGEPPRISPSQQIQCWCQQHLFQSLYPKAEYSLGSSPPAPASFDKRESFLLQCKVEQL